MGSVGCVCHLELNLFNQTVIIHTCTDQLASPGNEALMKVRAERRASTLSGVSLKKVLTGSICNTAMLYSWAQDSWRSLLTVLLPKKTQYVWRCETGGSIIKLGFGNCFLLYTLWLSLPSILMVLLFDCWRWENIMFGTPGYFMCDFLDTLWGIKCHCDTLCFLKSVSK